MRLAALDESDLQNAVEPFDSGSHLSSGIGSVPVSPEHPPIALRSLSRALNHVSHPPDHHHRGPHAASSVRSHKTRSASLQASSQVVRGRSLIPDARLLPASNGRKTVVGAKWPVRGLNSVKGRMVGNVPASPASWLMYSSRRSVAIPYVQGELVAG